MDKINKYIIYIVALLVLYFSTFNRYMNYLNTRELRLAKVLVVSQRNVALRESKQLRGKTYTGSATNYISTYSYNGVNS